MTTDSLSVFRKRMKEARERKNITLKELAEVSGCKEATMQRYESGNGIKTVPYDVIITISECLDVSPAYLMGWETPKKENAEILADIAGDPKLMSYIEKIKEMNNEDRQKVYDYIDFTIYSKKTGV